jgi:hypothetical protein
VHFSSIKELREVSYCEVGTPVMASITHASDAAQSEIIPEVPLDVVVQDSKKAGEPSMNEKADTIVGSTNVSMKEDIEVYDENGEPVIEPTEEELATLRRVSDKIPFTAFSVVIVEVCERFATTV